MSIRHAIGDTARRSGLNVDGERGHCGKCRRENDFRHCEPPKVQLPPVAAMPDLEKFIEEHRHELSTKD
jgi:hypothetical protein